VGVAVATSVLVGVRVAVAVRVGVARGGVAVTTLQPWSTTPPGTTRTVQPSCARATTPNATVAARAQRMAKAAT
jgi:hypothetical protein